MRDLAGHLQRPGQQRHRVNIGVAIMSALRRLEDVGNRVVGVVLVLPPLNGEALRDVADDQAEEIADVAVVEHLVVQEIMRQPAALLPEQRSETRAAEDRGRRVHRENQVERRSDDSQVRGALEHVVQRACAVKLLLADLRAQRAVVALHRREGYILLGQLAHEEFGHVVNGRGGVEGVERVGAVQAGVREDDTATRVVVPRADVVDAAAEDHPCVLRRVVGRHLLHRDALTGALLGSATAAHRRAILPTRPRAAAHGWLLINRTLQPCSSPQRVRVAVARAVRALTQRLGLPSQMRRTVDWQPKRGTPGARAAVPPGFPRASECLKHSIDLE
mmetsp:Transcript_47049/g.112802  ORF Transcript_47049/g.112802 Transcript_47049/m.112802 type:complete len:333 (+) Transcript_47049:691-1689(+)